jgi:hypothetical protein
MILEIPYPRKVKQPDNRVTRHACSLFTTTTSNKNSLTYLIPSMSKRINSLNEYEKKILLTQIIYNWLPYWKENQVMY